jgi:hypothetical protein
MQGTNETRISSWLDGIFGGSSSISGSQAQQPQQERKQ